MFGLSQKQFSKSNLPRSDLAPQDSPLSLPRDFPDTDKDGEYLPPTLGNVWIAPILGSQDLQRTILQN
jgi:hypothetical protein